MDDETERKLDDFDARPSRLRRLRDRLAFVRTEFDFYAAVAFGAAGLWYLHWPKLALLALPPLVLWRIARLSKDKHNDVHLLAACYIVWGAVIWIWLFFSEDIW
jgi:fatty acid desaturase